MTRLARTDSARASSSQVGVPTRDSASPSASRSLASTSAATVRPGWAVTRSSVATGAALVVGAGATPTRTVPVACAPKRSWTV